MSAPQTIEWSRLSPANMEFVQQVGLRMTAGFSLDEIASERNRVRPVLKHNALPAVVTKQWVAARMREVRIQIHETHADLTQDYSPDCDGGRGKPGRGAESAAKRPGWPK